MTSTPIRVDRFIRRLPAGCSAAGGAPLAWPDGGACVAVPPTAASGPPPSVEDTSLAPFGTDIARSPASLVPRLPSRTPSAGGARRDDDLVTLREPGQHLRLVVTDRAGLEGHRPLAVEPLHRHRGLGTVAVNRGVRHRQHVVHRGGDHRGL